MNKVCVVGGNGYVGRSILNIFIRSIYNITIIDNLSVNSDKLKYCDFINLDITNIDELNKIINNYDFVIWCSDIHPYQACELSEEKCKINNYECLTKLKFDNHFIFISDSVLYDNNFKDVMNEESQLDDSIDDYCFYKNMCEIFISENFNRYTILRPSNVYGDISGYIKIDNYLNSVVVSALKNNTLPLLLEDEPISIIHVKDLAKAILSVVEKKATGIYNVASLNTTFNNVMQDIKKFLNMPTIKYVDDEIDVNLFKHLETAKIKSLGFRPEFEMFNFVFNTKRMLENKTYINNMSNTAKYRRLLNG